MLKPVLLYQVPKTARDRNCEALADQSNSMTSLTVYDGHDLVPSSIETMADVPLALYARQERQHPSADLRIGASKRECGNKH